jgi:glycosyltransferase involved in cell wall biosynthesis
MRHAACWHATSPDEAQGLRHRAGAQRVDEIPNCVDAVVADEAARTSARHAIGLPPHAPYVLFLGRLHPIKRLDLLASAFSEVASAIPEARLVIAGPDEGGHRAAIQPRFAHVASRVHWCGAVDGEVKAGLLSGAAVLVLCSDSESFGMSVAEALSAAVPVVVTRTCPWPAIEAVGCGHWVAQTAPDVARGVMALLEHPDEARRCGERGRDFAACQFGPAPVGARWAALYREIVESGPGTDPVNSRRML